MGADQVAAIRPALAELEADERTLVPDAPARFFARFTVPEGDSPWVEIYLEREAFINLWHPSDDDPLERLSGAGVRPLPGTRIASSYKPACTLAARRGPSGDLARFVDALFDRLYGCGNDYPLDVELLRFPEQAG